MQNACKVVEKFLQKKVVDNKYLLLALFVLEGLLSWYQKDPSQQEYV